MRALFKVERLFISDMEHKNIIIGNGASDQKGS